MSDVVGSVRVNIRANADAVVSAFKKIGNSADDASEHVENLQEQIQKPAGDNGYSKELLKTQQEIERTYASIDSLQKKMSKMEALTPTEEYKQLHDQLDLVDAKLQELNEQSNALDEMNLPLPDALTDQIVELEEEYDSLIAKMLEMEEAGTAATSSMDDGRYANMTAEMDNLRLKLTELQSKEQELLMDGGAEEHIERIGEKSAVAAASIGSTARESKSAEEGIKRIGNQAKKSADQMDGLGKKIGQLAKRFLSLYVLTKGLRALMNATKEGLKNLSDYSPTFGSSIAALQGSVATLKNALGTLAAPIVQAVIPALIQLINWVTAAINAINNLIASIRGKATWTKAIGLQKDYQKSLGKTAGAAKQAQKQLAAFDELNVLNGENGAGGGGGGGDIAPEDMFEEVNTIPSKLTPIIEALKNRLKELADYFKQGFLDGLGDIGPRLATIKKGLQQIKDALIDIWTDPEVRRAATEWENSLAYMLGSIAGSMASIGLTIAANLIGGLGQYLEENTPRIKDYLVQMFDIGTEINYLVARAAQAAAYIFEAFASPQGVDLTANLIGIFADAFMGVQLLAAKFGRDIIQTITQPFVDNKEGFREALEGFLGILAEVTGVVKQAVDDIVDGLNQMYDEQIKPFFDNLTAALSSLTETVLHVWNDTLLPVIDGLAARLEPFYEEYVKPVIEKTISILGRVIDIVGKVLVEAIHRLEEDIKAIEPFLAPILEYIGAAVEALATGITTQMDIVLEVLEGVLAFVEDVFEVGWGQAWDNAKERFGQVWDNIVAKIREAVNDIIGAVNRMISAVGSAINYVIDMINSVSFTAPDWVPFVGGQTFGFHIAHVQMPQVPYLADGAVIRGGDPFLAVLGDQPAGQTNIEAPLSTLTGAFESANAQQNALLIEQNNLLRQILAKKTGITTRDIFSAVRNENQDFIMRNGRSAFDY